MANQQAYSIPFPLFHKVNSRVWIAEAFLLLGVFFSPLGDIRIFLNCCFSDLFFLLSFMTTIDILLRNKKIWSKKLMTYYLFFYAFLVISIASLFNASNFVLKEYFLTIIQFLFSFVVFLQVIFMYWLDPNILFKMITAYSLSVSLFVFAGLYGFLSGFGGTVLVTGMGRVQSLCGSPNRFAFYCMMSVILILCQLYITKIKSFQKVTIVIICIGSGITGLFFSGSRWWFVAVFLILLFLILHYFLRMGEIKSIIIPVLLLGCCYFLLEFIDFHQLSEAFFILIEPARHISKATYRKLYTFYEFLAMGGDLEAFGKRAIVNMLSWEYIVENNYMLLGIGLGSRGLLSEHFMGKVPHNIILSLWLEMGLLGVLWWVSFMALLAFNMFKKSYNEKLLSPAVLLYFILVWATLRTPMAIQNRLWWWGVAILIVISLKNKSPLSKPKIDHI